MLKSTLNRYKIGLAVIGAFTVFLLIFILAQAGTTRADANTFKAASDAAEKLNTYTDTKGKIPETLSETGAKNVPDTINYRKLSDETYRFCVTYKSKSTNFDARDTLLTAATGGSPLPNDGSNPVTSDYYLTVESSHNKGDNCQTVRPYLLSSNSSLQSSDFTTTGPYSECGNSYNYVMSGELIRSISTGSTASIQVADTATSASTTLALSSKVQVFDVSCNPLQLSQVKAGDYVNLYFNPYGDPVTMLMVTVQS